MSGIGRDGERILVSLRPEEAALVRTVMEQLLLLLGERPEQDGDPLAAVGISENAVRSDDPVLARLFPDAYRDDVEAAGEFRRYTEMGLRDGKREAARTVLDGLGPAGAAEPPDRDVDVVLDEEGAQVWLRALNDARLALGTRLDITEDWYEEIEDLDPRDPRAPLYLAYDMLSMIQESLVRVLW